jgi:hypothetical protein
MHRDHENMRIFPCLLLCADQRPIYIWGDQSLLLCAESRTCRLGDVSGVCMLMMMRRRVYRYKARIEHEIARERRHFGSAYIRSYLALYRDQKIHAVFSRVKNSSHTSRACTLPQQQQHLALFRSQEYCITTHRIWKLILKRSPTTQGVAFADDVLLMDELPQVLRDAADLIQAFHRDTDLEIQPINLNKITEPYMSAFPAFLLCDF